MVIALGRVFVVKNYFKCTVAANFKLKEEAYRILWLNKVTWKI